MKDFWEDMLSLIGIKLIELGLSLCSDEAQYLIMKKWWERCRLFMEEVEGPCQ